MRSQSGGLGEHGAVHTLEEVGQQFNVTCERIRQIETKALRKLKHPSRSRKMRSFLDQRLPLSSPSGELALRRYRAKLHGGEPAEPTEDWPYRDVWEAIGKAIYSLPSRFESELFVSGVLATDLFAFNSSLAASIEEQVVASLNRLRSLWDPDQKYALYTFERQSQTFPDVVLRTTSPGVEPRILMGIELKGWYVLAKEKAPSFRYKVTPAACAPPDLLVVFPWALSRVVSGSPQLFNPYVVGARYAAELRNHWWQHQRQTQGDSDITLSGHSGFYPTKRDTIADMPAEDQSNFGRIARTGVMDQYMADVFADNLMGIPIKDWQRFLSSASS